MYLGCIAPETRHGRSAPSSDAPATTGPPGQSGRARTEPDAAQRRSKHRMAKGRKIFIDHLDLRGEGFTTQIVTLWCFNTHWGARF